MTATAPQSDHRVAVPGLYRVGTFLLPSKRDDTASDGTWWLKYHDNDRDQSHIPGRFHTPVGHNLMLHVDGHAGMCAALRWNEQALFRFVSAPSLYKSSRYRDQKARDEGRLWGLLFCWVLFQRRRVLVEVGRGESIVPASCAVDHGSFVEQSVASC